MTRHARDIAIASSCTACSGEIGSPPPYAAGRHMATVHASHAAQLAALGWVVTDYPDQPSDIACPHYHAAYWRDGNNGGSPSGG